MSAKSSKGIRICITKGAATVVNLVPTAINSAKPAQVTVTNSLKDGDVVVMGQVGFPELNGKTFVVDNASATDFDLLGSDTTGTTGALAASPTAAAYTNADFECLCLSSLSVNPESPGTVDVSTYCASASIPSATSGAGTIDFAGYVDITDTDYAELLLAVEDGKQRQLRIMLPGNGYLVAPVTFSSISWDLPLDGAVGYAGSAVLGAKFTHLF